MTWDEFRAAAHRQSFAPYPYIVDGDIALYDEDALRRHYEAWLADAYAGQAGNSSALTVRNVLGADVIWPSPTRDALSYCISNSFGDRKAEVVTAMGRATRSWADRVAVHFLYRPDQDAACTNANNSVVFNVAPAVSTDFNAASFFPDYSRANRQLLITDAAFTTHAGGRDFQGILRHETGHILGFRHEHIQISCGTESTAESRQVTSYDVNSVMHYPECRPGGSGGYRQTALDFAGAASLYGYAARTSDILWRNVNTGESAAWIMANGGVGAVVPLFTYPLEWQPQAVGDFNGDGTTDVAWHDVNTGESKAWLMAANGRPWAFNPLSSDPVEWQIQGAGDFNGDGTTDILRHNTRTGEFSEWIMSNGAIGASLPLFAEPAEWQVQGTGDFNNDGTSDILWRNVNTGEFAEWIMADGGVGAVLRLDTRPVEWQVSGIGDFNGDGTSDILLHNVNTGEFTQWMIANGAVSVVVPLYTELLEWQVKRIGDFNGDGTSDFLWLDVRTGEYAEWLMSNGGVGAVIPLYIEPLEWQVPATGNFNGQ